VLREGAYMLFYVRTAPTPPLDAVAEDAGPATATAAAGVMAAADVYHASAPIGPTLPAAAAAAASSQGSCERTTGRGTATSLGKRKAEEVSPSHTIQRMMAEHQLSRLAELSAQQLQPSRFTTRSSSRGSQVETRAERMEAHAEGPLELGLASIYRTTLSSVTQEWRRKIRKLVVEKRVRPSHLRHPRGGTSASPLPCLVIRPS